MENCRAKLCRKLTSAWHNFLPLTDCCLESAVAWLRPNRIQYASTTGTSTNPDMIRNGRCRCQVEQHPGRSSALGNYYMVFPGYGSMIIW